MNWVQLVSEAVVQPADLVFLKGETPNDAWFDPSKKQGSGPYEREPQYCNPNGYGNGNWKVSRILLGDGNSQCTIWRDISGEYRALHGDGNAGGKSDWSKPKAKARMRLSPYFSIPSPLP